MDIASLAGILIGVAMCVLGILTSGEGGFALVVNFADLPSLFITVGGSISSDSSRQ